jgi:hypothetical protein
MKNNAPTTLSRPETKQQFRERMERDEERGMGVANRIHKAMSRFDAPLPEWQGDASYRRGEIYQLPETELSTHLANLGHKNMANMFATDQVAAMANIAKIMSMSNEERFTASYFSTPLTAFTVGWQDPEDLESLIEFVAPKVVAPRRFEYKLAINKESFFSDLDDERAIGSEFPRVEYRGLSNYSKTINRGLKYRIDIDEEGAGIINEQLIVGRLLQRCRRNQWRRASAALIALTSLLNTAVTWTYNSSSNPTPQPVEDMRAQLQRAQLTSGVFPNRMLSDLISWNLALSGYSHQLTAGAIASYDMTPDDIVAKLMLDGFMVAKAIYTSAVGQQSNLNGTKSYVYPSNVTAFYGQNNPGLDDPSNFKRFTTAAGDGDFRVFRQQQGPKFVDITVEYYDNILNTATVGANQLTPS